MLFVTGQSCDMLASSVIPAHFEHYLIGIGF